MSRCRIRLLLLSLLLGGLLGLVGQPAPAGVADPTDTPSPSESGDPDPPDPLKGGQPISLLGVRLGDTDKQVFKVLGRPSYATDLADLSPAALPTRQAVYQRDKAKLELWIQSGKVVMMRGEGPVPVYCGGMRLPGPSSLWTEVEARYGPPDEVDSTTRFYRKRNQTQWYSFFVAGGQVTEMNLMGDLKGEIQLR